MEKKAHHLCLLASSAEKREEKRARRRPTWLEAIFNGHHLIWIGLDAPAGQADTNNYTETAQYREPALLRWVEGVKRCQLESHNVSANSQLATLNVQRISLHVRNISRVPQQRAVLPDQPFKALWFRSGSPASGTRQFSTCSHCTTRNGLYRFSLVRLLGMQV